MTKSESTNAAKKAFAWIKSSRKKERWNVFGMRREDQRDPAALTFARLGLLATRW